MEEDPAYVRAVSLHLSRVLDEVGLNELMIKRRRRTFLFLERLESLYFPLAGLDTSAYYFGSQTEGATTRGLNSDVDRLHDSPGYNVIQDWSDWQQGQKNLLMLQDRTAPGYCRLQVLRDDVPKAVKFLDNTQYTYDSDGRIVLQNTSFNKPDEDMQEVRNGPANTQLGSQGYLDKDTVSAIHCKYWPTQAASFIPRRRRHGWPSENLLQEVVKHGVFLVPVGFKLSPTEQLEWRISASLTERCLMFSLDTVHIKCYTVLKMLVKAFIEPSASKSISSYHCKTAILYSVENTEIGFWRDDNLLRCITHCLALLLTWVTDGFCPQFVLPEENLFVGKVTYTNRNTIQSTLEDLIKSKGCALLQVDIDDLGIKLQEKINTVPSVVPILDSPETVKLIAGLAFIKQRNITIKCINMVVNNESVPLVTTIRSVYRTIVMCEGRMRHSETHDRRIIKLYIDILSRWLGSMMASLSLSRGMKVPQMAIQLLRIGVEYDVASKLKLASVFYNNGYFHTVETLLCEVENYFTSNRVKPLCACYNSPPLTVEQFDQAVYLSRDDKARAKLFVDCVRFSPNEINSAPPALRYELFRSVGDDIQRRDAEQVRWMDLAVVDCIPYLYYLQYMTYRQLGKLDSKKKSLYSLIHCLQIYKDLQSLRSLVICPPDYQDLFHIETAFNLTGQCMEVERQPEAAMFYYITSLAIRPINNAAKWHVAILCYKLIKPQQQTKDVLQTLYTRWTPTSD